MDFLASRTVKNIFVFFVDYPVDDSFLRQPKWTDNEAVLLKVFKRLQWNSNLVDPNISLFISGAWTRKTQNSYDCNC